MPTQEDSVFAKITVHNKLLSQEKINACMKAVEKAAEETISRAEEAGKEVEEAAAASKKVETRLEFLTRMYKVNKARQTEEAKKAEQAEAKEKEKEDE